MKPTLRILFLLIAAASAVGQSPASDKRSNLPKQPEAFAQRLYQQVIARRPSGIPVGENWNIFAPYMSKALLHRIDDFSACVAEWERRPNQDPRHPEKAPFGVFESGIFSGGDEKTDPSRFHVVRTEMQKNGSIRVYVALTLVEHGAKPWIWQVAPVLIRENGHLALDDVIYLKDGFDSDYRLSDSLSYDCNGSHWVRNRELSKR